MSPDSIQKSLNLNENASSGTETFEKVSSAKEGKILTFKDWKAKEDVECGPKAVNNSKQTKLKNASKTFDGNHRKINSDFNISRQGNVFPSRYHSIKTFNGMNNSSTHLNSFGTLNNAYNIFKNFGFNNLNSYYVKNNINFPNANYFEDGRNLPDNFFASDGIYRQRDLMQKPLKSLFKSDVNAKQFLQEIHTAQHSNEIKNSGNVSNNTKKVMPSSENKKSLGENPTIFVNNPNASKHGKAFTPKPKLAEKNLQISKEEKKRQWKEYREAMKPFKNRYFYNAKRVVQRLGKKDVKELNEKELFRLTNARDVMVEHKARLTAKYSDYVKAESQSNEFGEIYILKKPFLKDWKTETTTKKYQTVSYYRESHRNSIVPGRKILGGYDPFKRFVPGGVVEISTQRISAL